MLNSQRIFLVGYMGVGKSTLGKRLAHLLNYQFIDTDRYIEQDNKMTVDQIFETHGETFFRAEEYRVLQLISEQNNVVVATGGGMPCNNLNMTLMLEKGKVIYLKASSGLLYQRLRGTKVVRPLLKGLTEEEIKQDIDVRLSIREPYYSQAHYTVEIPVKSVESLVKSMGLEE